MANTKSAKNAEIHAMRDVVNSVQERLTKLHSDFELEKKEREQLLKSLEYELSNCRNGTQREPIHQRIEYEKKETNAIFKVYQKDIYDCGLEVVDRRYELRVLLNEVFDAEYRKFKDSLNMNEAFRAFAFYRQTFDSGDWNRFLHLLFPKPSSDQLDSFAEEVDALVE